MTGSNNERRTAAASPTTARSDQSLRQGGSRPTDCKPRKGTEKPHHLDIQHDDINCTVVKNRRPPSRDWIRWAEQMCIPAPITRAFPRISSAATHPQVRRICAAATTIVSTSRRALLTSSSGYPDKQYMTAYVFYTYKPDPTNDSYYPD